MIPDVELLWLDDQAGDSKTPLPLEEIEAEYVADIMRALAHPIRVEIIVLLGFGPSAVTNLAIGLDLPQPNISKHLKTLTQAGLVDSTVEANTRIYTLARPHITQAITTMAQDLDD